MPAHFDTVAFVKKHGVVLASGAGPVPSIAEAVAGAPIRGSWWGHPAGHAIFAALSQLDERDDVLCFKLVGGKVTFVHRRLWPALVALADELGPRLTAIRQEHTATGAHRNVLTPYPDWVPPAVRAAAEKLTPEAARAALGPALRETKAAVRNRR
jgi:hypothetical protein